jgi:hypothetical protein
MNDMNPDKKMFLVSFTLLTNQGRNPEGYSCSLNSDMLQLVWATSEEDATRKIRLRYQKVGSYLENVDVNIVSVSQAIE